MNIRQWLISRFIPCGQKERDAALRLLAAARWHAAAPQTPVAGTRDAAFTYRYTVAFAVIAILGANMYFPPEKRRGVTVAITAALEKWRAGAYDKDGQHLMAALNLSGESSEAALGGWVSGEGALERDKESAEQLGRAIMTQAGETVVALFLEDKNKE
ncbi:hypothetical protein [Anaeroselena agilis]|uniref:Uncharacterized protein n=1 Tax=Anaeroselena agilis TaxID=3063788 RepID=A0ABU3P1A6_9FIRM|nr:hypothetical protein [Selenomonadales bacterium 4137-cl]